MLTFVDTSVWVSFFRGRSITLVTELRRLLEEDRVALAAPTRVELLCGARTSEQGRLTRVLGAVPTFRPTDATWVELDRWALLAASRGHVFGFGDLLIGAIASENGGLIWSLDSDFVRLQSLGLVRMPAR
ncbi:MAG: PIN domain-containing protein [Deltaproteobacteria bacterium]|nr:PIN domain-containing protein [Deltaproteobacteria bacterium]